MKTKTNHNGEQHDAADNKPKVVDVATAEEVESYIGNQIDFDLGTPFINLASTDGFAYWRDNDDS
tara:strand:- start:932 stop:1126 length:195 start_codon:yes stop_codon:yes gene_type:complete